MLTETSTSIGFLMHDVARAMRHRFDVRARTLGVTRQQWRALLYLSRHEGSNQAELADRLDVERITACRMIDRLAEAGLVERRADPADRRVWRLHLLPAAWEMVEQLTQISTRIEEEALALMGKDTETVRSALQQLRESFRGEGARAA